MAKKNAPSHMRRLIVIAPPFASRAAQSLLLSAPPEVSYKLRGQMIMRKISTLSSLHYLFQRCFSPEFSASFRRDFLPEFIGGLRSGESFCDSIVLGE